MNPKARSLTYVALALMSVASIAPANTAQTAQTGAPRDLDAYAARVLKEFEVPGLAVAIVKDGKVVLAKGYGVRKLGEPTPVDENTLFGRSQTVRLAGRILEFGPTVNPPPLERVGVTGWEGW